jgi:hypothetical protein
MSGEIKTSLFVSPLFSLSLHRAPATSRNKNNLADGRTDAEVATKAPAALNFNKHTLTGNFSRLGVARGVKNGDKRRFILAGPTGCLPACCAPKSEIWCKSWCRFSGTLNAVVRYPTRAFLHTNVLMCSCCGGAAKRLSGFQTIITL